MEILSKNRQLPKLTPRQYFVLYSNVSQALNDMSIALFDTRKGSHPMETSPVEHSHKDPVHKVIFPSSKTGRIITMVDNACITGLAYRH